MPFIHSLGIAKTSKETHENIPKPKKNTKNKNKKKPKRWSRYGSSNDMHFYIGINQNALLIFLRMLLIYMRVVDFFTNFFFLFF